MPYLESRYLTHCSSGTGLGSDLEPTFFIPSRIPYGAVTDSNTHHIMKEMCGGD